jgi:hypothetical protein
MGIGVGSVIGAGLSLVGGSKAAKGYEETGKRARKRGQEQQIYNEVAATQAIAVGQIAALEEERQARLIASRAIAVAAAGGAVRLKFEGSQAAKYGADQEEMYKDQAKATRINSLASAFQFLPTPSFGGATTSRPSGWNRSPF